MSIFFILSLLYVQPCSGQTTGDEDFNKISVELDSLLSEKSDGYYYNNRITKEIHGLLDELDKSALDYVDTYINDSTESIKIEFLCDYIVENAGKYDSSLTYITLKSNEELIASVIISLGIYNKERQLSQAVKMYYSQSAVLKNAVIKAYDYIHDEESVWQLNILHFQERDVETSEEINMVVDQITTGLNSYYKQNPKNIINILDAGIRFHEKDLASTIKDIIGDDRAYACLKYEFGKFYEIEREDSIEVQEISKKINLSIDNVHFEVYSMHVNDMGFIMIVKSGLVMAMIQSSDRLPDIDLYDFDNDSNYEIVSNESYGANSMGTTIYKIRGDSILRLFGSYWPFKINKVNNTAEIFILPYTYIDGVYTSRYGSYPVSYSLQNDTFIREADPYIDALYYLENYIENCVKYQQIVKKILLENYGNGVSSVPALIALSYVYMLSKDMESSEFYYNEYYKLNLSGEDSYFLPDIFWNY